VFERIALENDELEGDNNCYLLTQTERTVLIDTAPGNRWGDLFKALRTHDLSPVDVDDVFLTHWHPDHSGLAGAVQWAANAEVHAHKADTDLMSDSDAWAGYGHRQAQALEQWDVPREKRHEFFRCQEDTHEGNPASVPAVSAFGRNASFVVGETTINAIPTAGHTAGSVVYEVDRTGPAGLNTVITGDTLLPNYSPNIGGSDVRLDRSLDRLLGSLRYLIQADYDRAYPGHGTAIQNPSERAHELITHHDTRARDILRLLRDRGPADVWTVARNLFGDLERFHILIGAGEAHAHLEYLERGGALCVTDGVYRVSNDWDRKVWESDGYVIDMLRG